MASKRQDIVSLYTKRLSKILTNLYNTNTDRLQEIIKDERVGQAFEEYVSWLRVTLYKDVDTEQALTLLSHYMVIRPLLPVLFAGHTYISENRVTKALEKMYAVLEQNGLVEDICGVETFYKDVVRFVEQNNNEKERQELIIKLYDNFFKLAFEKVQKQLGIVYTPVEVVDFMIHSVDDVLRKEFGRGLTDENVNILDPFTGTGTFIVRLLQSGLIEAKDLDRKYSSEIFANEIVLLAYYIAAVNIENAYHAKKTEDTSYIQFGGICLTDTFQINEFDEKEHLAVEYFPANNERVERQKKTPITVIMSNPPYAAGQKSANDNAQNMKYPKLAKRIKDTYSATSLSDNMRSLYDSYVKAFRWASDRIGENDGIICFITNNSWIDGNTFDGFRKHLESEFSLIHIIDLRGSLRGKNGDELKKEGENIFDVRVGVAIILLVKRRAYNSNKANIYYHNIGDYLRKNDKLTKLNSILSVVNKDIVWDEIHPNQAYDWINYRNPIFETFIPMINKNGNFNSFFVTVNKLLKFRGVETTRDSWCYNSSFEALEKNIVKSIDFYNMHVDKCCELLKNNKNIKLSDVLDFDSTQFSWNDTAKKDVKNGKYYAYHKSCIYHSLYKPFYKQYLYFHSDLIHRMSSMPYIFKKESSMENRVICISGNGTQHKFSVLMSNILPDLELVGKSQCFPLYYYLPTQNKCDQSVNKYQVSLFNNTENQKEEEGDEYVRKDGVSDFILSKAHEQYGDTTITKEDIFYYVYGFLHSKEYRNKFSTDLRKMLARIPLVETKEDFIAFSKAGRKLADLHLNYETVAPYDGIEVSGVDSDNFRVTHMKFATVKNEAGKKVHDKSTILFNEYIMVKNIPQKAYDYIIGGKSAVEWIMSQYCVSKDKKSGIVNDANAWADEVGNPRYILDLLLSIINVSVQTVDIVNNLPTYNLRNK